MWDQLQETLRPFQAHAVVDNPTADLGWISAMVPLEPTDLSSLDLRRALFEFGHKGRPRGIQGWWLWWPDRANSGGGNGSGGGGGVRVALL